LYRRVISEYDKKNELSNIVNTMKDICGEKKDEIINRQLEHFFPADMAVAKGLGVTMDEKMMNHH
jgi:catalase